MGNSFFIFETGSLNAQYASALALNDVKKVIRKKPAKKIKKVAISKRPVAKRPSTKRVAKIKVAKEGIVKMDDLTNIKGIGPKASTILIKAGFGSFSAVAKASKKELETVLSNAGTRYARLNPAPWIKEAKKLAKK